MLIKIVILVAVLLILFIIMIAVQPAEFSIRRSASMLAPPLKIFSQVNDFHKWKDWSPWAKLDPNSKETFEGTPEGVGTIFNWDGNKKVGAGRMTILQSDPDRFIQMKLEFLRPFKTTNRTEFNFETQGDATLVTWTMTGQKNFISKAFCLVMDMDQMVGKDFAKGLAQLKAIAEQPDKTEV